MRKIFISLFALLALYCGAWFGVANIVENKIQELDLASSESAKKLEVKVSGFPFDFVINLRNPSFGFSEEGASIFTNFNGNFKLSFSWLLKSISLETDGGATIHGNVNGEKFNLIADAGENTRYNIQLKESPMWGNGLTLLLAAKENPLGLLHLLKTIKVEAGKCFVKSANNQSIFLADKIKLELDTDFGNKTKLALMQDLVNVQFSDNSLVLWQSLKRIPLISKLYEQMPRDLQEYLSVFTLPQLGKINYAVDLKYEGKDSIFDMSIENLNLKDNMLNLSLSGDIYSDNSTLELDLVSNSKFSENWYQLMKIYAQKFAKHSQVTKSKSHSLFGSLWNDFKLLLGKGNAAVYASYVPRLQDYKNIRNNVSLKLESGKSNYTLSVKKLDFVVEPYSLVAKGSYQQQEGQQAYSGEFNLNNYDLILDDAFAYTKRITAAMGRKLFLGDSALNLSDYTCAEIKRFVRQISNEPNSNAPNISIAVSKKPASKFPAVGKYDATEFAIIWMQFTTNVLVNEVTDKVKKYLPKNIQDKVQEQVDKIAPLQEIFTLFK